jgi:hypothetical protein
MIRNVADWHEADIVAEPRSWRAPATTRLYCRLMRPDTITVRQRAVSAFGGGFSTL